MDDGDVRGGRPTVHKACDDASAILAGDSRHALAFEGLAAEATHGDPCVRAQLIAELARAAGPSGMAGGQMMDLMAEESTLDLPAVTRLQQLKTGALIGFCLEAGAIMGRVPPEGRTPLRGYARDVGLAFQIADDLLDAEGEEAKTGKRVGKDRKAGKETFVSLLGSERARQQAEALVGQAAAHLQAFGAEADLLRAIARFAVERDHWYWRHSGESPNPRTRPLTISRRQCSWVPDQVRDDVLGKDRKSGLLGRRAVVGVDLGVRRIFKKKNN